MNAGTACHGFRWMNAKKNSRPEDGPYRLGARGGASVFILSLVVQQSAQNHSAAEPFLEERRHERNADEVQEEVSACHRLELIFKPLRHFRHLGIDDVSQETKCDGG